MAFPFPTLRRTALGVLAACALACQAGQPGLSAPGSAQGLSVGGWRVAPAVQAAPGGFWGPAAAVESDSGWFASAGVARSMAPLQGPRPSYGFADARTVSAGYRFSPDTSLSMSLTSASGLDLGGARVQRLGLAVRYDWPAYYVRLGLDPRFGPLPQDTLRLSAGWKF